MHTRHEDAQLKDRLTALSAVIDELQAHLFHTDRDLCDLLARKCQSFFSAEDVSVFLVSDENPRELELFAEQPNLVQISQQPVLIPNDPPEPKCGLTGWCVVQPKASRFNRAALIRHPAVAVAAPDDHQFTKSGCYSLLAVPLCLKPGRPLGLLKINNRLGPDGQAAEGVEFSEEDEFFASILATKVAAHLDTRRVMRAFRDLTDAGDTCQEPREYYGKVLQTGRRLLRADRAMLALADARHVPVMEAIDNRSGVTPVGWELPTQSIMRRCWSQRQSEIIADVTGNNSYHEFDKRTRSEAAVLLTWEGIRFGVLNVESDRPGHFDQHDEELLCALVPFIAAAYRAVAKENHFRHILEELSTYRWTHASVLFRLLETALAAFGFANGHIFVPGPDGRVLKMIARVGAPIDESRVPQFPLDGPPTSVQRRVFDTRAPLFSDAAESDDRFDRDGLAVLGVSGPYLAIPLLAGGRAVGVLSVWGGAGTIDSRVPSKADETRLTQYARAAAALVDLSAKRQTFLRTMTEAIPTLQKPSGQADLWGQLLRIVQQSGFARVRLFRYWRERNEFVLLAAVGDGAPPPGLTVSSRDDGNPYAFDTIRRAKREPSPFQYYGTEFGPDPDAARLGKADGASWAVIPLISHGRLYGQITADNGTDVGVTSAEALENLELIGGIAAMAVAQAETASRLSWQSLDKLHAAISYHDDERAVIRKLLVYLTHGDALGFARAAYFAYRPDRQVFEYQTALGSVTAERYRRIAAIHEPIEMVLAAAGEHKDLEIEAALRSAVAPLATVQTTELLAPGYSACAYDPAVKTCPEWARKLAQAIGSAGILVAPVAGIEGKLYGLFVTDRKWQFRPLLGPDEAILTSFGRHAALLLERQEGPSRANAAERGAVWKDIALVTSHRIKTPVSTIHNECDNITALLARPCAGPAPDDTAREIDAALDNMRKAIQRANEVVKQFAALRDVYLQNKGARSQTCRVDDLARAVWERAGDSHVEVTYQISPELIYHGFPGHLEECLVELVVNGCYWAQQSERAPEVEIRADEFPIPDSFARSDGRYLRVTVRNWGPPLPPDVELGGGLVKPTRPGGSGFGLFFVYEVVRALHGTVTHTNPDDGGCCFELSIPQHR